MKRGKAVVIVGHGIFWMLSYAIIFIALSIDYDMPAVNHVMTLTFHLPLVALVYTNAFLFRRFFLNNKYLLYLVGMSLLIALSGLLSSLLFSSGASTLFPNFFFVSPYSRLQILAIHVTYLAVSFLLFLGFNWMVVRDREQRLQLEKNKVTLKSLRTQINPHFLFNSLNNIYSLTQDNDSKAAHYIMSLSESLRYMTYDVEAEFVPLEEDLQQLTNYFELEKIRFNPTDEIQLEIEGDSTGIPIAPLLLLPMLENAFKYLDPSNPKLHCRIRISSGEVQFKARNRKRVTNHQTSGGLGLKNLRKRLKLLYPKQFELHTNETEDEYSIFLNLELTDRYV